MKEKEAYRRPTPVDFQEPEDLSYLEPMYTPDHMFVVNLHFETRVHDVKTFFKGFGINVSIVGFSEVTKDGVPKRECLVKLAPSKMKKVI